MIVSVTLPLAATAPTSVPRSAVLVIVVPIAELVDFEPMLDDELPADEAGELLDDEGALTDPAEPVVEMTRVVFEPATLLASSIVYEPPAWSVTESSSDETSPSPSVVIRFTPGPFMLNWT